MFEDGMSLAIKVEAGAISAAKTDVDVIIIDTKTKKLINVLDSFLNILIILSPNYYFIK